MTRRLSASMHACVLLFLTAVWSVNVPFAERGHAQEAPPKTSSITGHVFGPDGRPVPGVSVFLRRDGTDLATRVVTDEEGAFRIDGLAAPAAYQVMCAIGSLVEAGPMAEWNEAGVAAVVDVHLKLSVAEQVSVTADAWNLPVEPPNSVVSRTAHQLREQNLFNPDDAIRNLPSTTSRKRYLGDRNGLVGGRSFGTLQPTRALVYLDGYLLSSFLGRFDAPRWNMITPEALDRVDVLYGPFSAVHAGNSMGTTIVMTERVPTKLTWGVRVDGANQSFTQYDHSAEYGAGQISAYAGGRASSGVWAAMAFNHEDATGQPMQWYTVTADGTGAFPEAPGHAIPVSGIRYDTDPKGLRRAVFGANAGAIDHTTQDTAKVRVGYTLPSQVDISGLVAVWRNDTANRDTTFLRDANGNEVWQGRVTDGTTAFTIPAAALAPSLRAEHHSQLGVTARSRRPSGWNGSVIASDYRILDDASRQADAPDPVAANGGSGTVTRRDGTGWSTLEVQATRTPSPGGRHTVTFGAHHNAYRLTNLVNNASDWRTTETTLGQRYSGRSAVNAFYAQDVFKVRDDVKLTLGWRAEWFDTWDGAQMVRVGGCTANAGAGCNSNGDGTFNKTLAYPRRSLSGQSPKASLAWTANEHLIVRTSYGRGERFPNVEELYNGTVTATSVSLSDPNLKAERANAVELSAETFWTHHMLRTSYFYDDVRDAILRQADVTVIPNITNVSNVDRVRTPGLEVVWVAQDAPIAHLSIEANATFADSRVVENMKDPASVGKYWLRVPKTRGSVVLAYRPTTRWMGSVGVRHQGRAYNDAYNLDINPNTYGGVSRINQMDLRVSYKPIGLAEFAIGVDNVTNSHAYVFHPFPGRTIFLQLRVASQ